jgi:hypothetical protein
VKETWFVSFNLGDARLPLTRTLLAKADLTEVATLDPEGHPCAGMCSITVAAGDARIAVLQNELARHGSSASVRLDRHYSDRELDQFPWLQLVVATAGLMGGVNYRQPYNRADACQICGAGASPIGPLIAELARMGRKHIDRTAHDGHIVVTRTLADAVREAGLTGTEVTPVRRDHLPNPDPRFAWLNLVSEWPPMVPTLVLAVEDLCPACGRTGHFDPGDRPAEWHYRNVPDNAGDFNCTWERFGVWRGQPWDSGYPPVGGSAGVIVSQRVRQLFARVGVRQVQYAPVLFDKSAGASGAA